MLLAVDDVHVRVQQALYATGAKDGLGGLNVQALIGENAVFRKQIAKWGTTITKKYGSKIPVSHTL